MARYARIAKDARGGKMDVDVRAVRKSTKGPHIHARRRRPAYPIAADVAVHYELARETTRK